jgi:hypothetical protein
MGWPMGDARLWEMHAYERHAYEMAKETTKRSPTMASSQIVPDMANLLFVASWLMNSKDSS